jgi:Carboxypeptidase regulatory-like domain/TonB-dependent Receptor Plug Domain/TonB dependent receptor-like, beta-barrel
MLTIGTAAHAQTRAALTGTVTVSGAAVPGVTVTITSPALQGSRTAQTDVNGNYNFGALPPGDYHVKFELESMQAVDKNVRVGLNETARMDADMKMSELTEAITVTANATAVLETNEIQTNLKQDVVNNLPVQRTLQSTTSLAPGVVVSNSASNGASGGGAASGAIQIAGAPAYDSAFLVNGASVNENLRGQPHNLFIEDAIQETTVLTGAISAEYGRFTGGVVSAITKSGGNQFSGSFRDTLTNDRWTAQGDLSRGPSVDKINPVYEGTLGGRIIKDRLWFFAAGRYANRNQTNTFGNDDATPFIFGNKDERLEGKLTGQLTDKHSIVGSYLRDNSTLSNFCSFAPCLDTSSLELNRKNPNNIKTAEYSGIITPSLLIQGNWSKKYFAFIGGGGSGTTPADGTPVITALGTGEGYAGDSIFCARCDPEERNNTLWGVKGTYYLASKGFGTHNIVGGYDDWSEQRIANNYQSASNFIVYTLGTSDNDLIAPTCVGPDANSIVCHPNFNTGDLIKWNPIFQLTKGSDFTTRSVFVNDKWDLNSKWSFNLGLRYDKNHGVDSSGNVVANDSAIGPRLGVILDPLANGRFRLNASYSRYVSRVAESVGGGASGGGNPSYLYYGYTGPAINPDHTLTTTQALQQMFDYFFAHGGTNNPALFGNLAGIATRINGSLKSPSVDEYSFGGGWQVSKNAYLRVDLQHKDWKNFYALVANPSTGEVPGIVTQGNTTVDLGQNFDLAFITNSDHFKRTYNAATLQGAYQPFARTNVGLNYTYSTLKGNVLAETTGSGPIAETALAYPEYRGYAQFAPQGYLPGDQRHRLNAWVSYDQPLGFGSAINLSLLQRYASGSSYSAIGQLDTTTFTPNGLPAGFAYNGPPATVSYFFGGRGSYRWDDVSSTDVAATFNLPVHGLTFFAQGKVINSFNNQAQTNGNTTVRILKAFNPFTETPVEGVNWAKGSNFGKPRNPTTSAGANLLAPNGDFQLPRTYLISVGARF